MRARYPGWAIKAAAVPLVVLGYLRGAPAWANDAALPQTPRSSRAEHSTEATHVVSVVEKIRAEPSGMGRTSDAERLCDAVKRTEGRDVSDADIDALASLMSDRDDSVRYWIACSLGFVGPRAKRAVPQLEEALKEVACVHADKTSESAIRIALTRIGSTPPALTCIDGKPVQRP